MQPFIYVALPRSTISPMSLLSRQLKPRTGFELVWALSKRTAGLLGQTWAPVAALHAVVDGQVPDKVPDL